MDGRIDPPSSLLKLDVEKLRQKASDEVLVLAWDKIQLAGCVFAKPTRHSLYVGKLAVALEYRGLGISRRLIAACDSIAIERNLPSVELETRVELTENQSLFEYLGFERIEENAHEGFDRPTSYLYRKIP